MSEVAQTGNTADVFLKDGKYFCYLNGKKLCQSKRILDIEMLLLVKRWTQKARDANVTSLKFHFDERAARDAETPVTKDEKPTDKYVVVRNGHLTTVTANDDATPDRQMTPKDRHEIRRRACELSCLRRFFQQNCLVSNFRDWLFPNASLLCG
jgi:hypothetical protein